MIKLAFCSVFRKKQQSILTILLMGIGVFVIVLMYGIYQLISTGISLTDDRLGADVIILPRTADMNYNSALYTAEPSNDYIQLDDVDFLNNDTRIDRMTYQFFTHTIEAGCCTSTSEARVVGFDQTTDFLIKPWLELQNFDSLGEDEVIIGGDISSIIGQQMSILGRTYKIVGTLYSTGSGLDQSIFMDINEAREVAKENFSQNDVETTISSILIKLNKNVNVNDFVQNFNRNNSALIAVSKTQSLKYVESQLYGWGELVALLVVSLILTLLISLFIRFTAMVHSRKKEFGYLRAVGIRKGEIFISLLLENVIISVVCGIVFSIVAIFCISPLLEEIRDFFLFPAITLKDLEYIKMIILGVSFAMGVSTVSCAIPIYRTLRGDPQEELSTDFE